MSRGQRVVLVLGTVAVLALAAVALVAQTAESAAPECLAYGWSWSYLTSVDRFALGSLGVPDAGQRALK